MCAVVYLGGYEECINIELMPNDVIPEWVLLCMHASDIRKSTETQEKTEIKKEEEIINKVQGVEIPEELEKYRKKTLVKKRENFSLKKEDWYQKWKKEKR